MKSYAFRSLAAAGLVAGLFGTQAIGQQTTGTVEAHLAAAKAAAGEDHQRLYNSLCVSPSAGPNTGAPTVSPARETWYVEPMKVFDNLYFVGEKEYSAWAVNTSDGIILIDTIWDYSVEDAVVGGLRKLGLDPARLKYALVSHAHIDHIGGAKHLQDKFGTRILMSEADWQFAETSPRLRTKPKRDMVVVDGQKLTLGDTSITMYLTPGHTLGTVSTLCAITWFQNGPSRYNGIELFDRNMNFQRQLTQAGGHMDVTRDTNGDEVLVWTNAADPAYISENGIVKVRLSDGHQTTLVTFDWSLAVHVSAPDSSGWRGVWESG